MPDPIQTPGINARTYRNTWHQCQKSIVQGIQGVMQTLLGYLTFSEMMIVPFRIAMIRISKLHTHLTSLNRFQVKNSTSFPVTIE